MSVKILSGKVFLVITGASRGIGRQLAISFGSILEKGSHILLLATNLNALKETAKNIPPSIFVDTVSIDLAKATKDKLYDIIIQSLKNEILDQFDHVVVIHNVGSIGNINQYANDLTELNVWHDYYDLNVFIPAILNGVIMKIFNKNTNTKKLVINITSLLGIKPEKSMAYYCSGKAAREMFFKVFALENPQVNVLNYSPGPVETDMYHEVCTKIADEEVKTQFNDLLTKKTILTCEKTVNRLLTILEEQKYKSGDHVDYYDEL
ncbi:sepiapterin reductase [Apis mellifera caucasica]|uniref:Sepiapterin reductase n=1 Tax=Apis mellifera TaxID=7460 RepID=A0A7M7M5A8_APIME|nr:sepiapterin reductase [Apis mellifera]KAG6797417.1 sepiapterin reductase [Apis mellifera caucasica]KAG9430091.1 sepiapterin reductase [Apis mellifera carnica]|eukprot:XP_016770924.1 sepiapterin reductase [Apis mellifera]